MVMSFARIKASLIAQGEIHHEDTISWVDENHVVDNYGDVYEIKDGSVVYVGLYKPYKY